MLFHNLRAELRVPKAGHTSFVRLPAATAPLHWKYSTRLHFNAHSLTSNLKKN